MGGEVSRRVGVVDLAAIHVGERDVTERLVYDRPDDGNPNDRSLARLPLEHAVAPGGTVEVTFDFSSRLPRVFARAGHAAPFFMVAQWFPKLGAMRGGKWACHQYHSTTEFAADFGTYDVALTVPSAYVVGHTGVARGERDNGDGTKTLDVTAENVHDFAWVADPRFDVVEETVGAVHVRLLVQPHHHYQARRYLIALRAAIERYEAWFGPYPYPALTAVDPGPGAREAGGMEYPMLITLGTTWWMPPGLRLPEVVTVHEFGHQYWYGAVANDEVRDAWLDEGVNSYVETLLMDDAYGAPASYVDFLGLQLDGAAAFRLDYLVAPTTDAIVTPAHRMLDSDSYNSTTYAKTALTLLTLDRYLGGDRLRTALRDYYRAWRFRHPTGADFRRAIEQSVGEPLEWYFSQTLDGTGQLDYAVARIEGRDVKPVAGRERDAGAAEAPSPPRYRTEVIVERRGEVRMPVDIVVTFDDGSETREVWDGQERWRRLDIVSTQRAAYAVVDPDNKLALDVDRLNNSRMRQPGTRGIVRLAGRWGLWMQGLLHLLTGF